MKMKLIQAVKILEESGLTPELYFSAKTNDPFVIEETLLLFGVRRRTHETRYNSNQERDIVVCSAVNGAFIRSADAVNFMADIEKGMAESRAREAKGNADLDSKAA